MFKSIKFTYFISYICTYIYIYIYVHVYVHIYIKSEREREIETTPKL